MASINEQILQNQRSSKSIEIRRLTAEISEEQSELRVLRERVARGEAKILELRNSLQSKEAESDYTYQSQANNYRAPVENRVPTEAPVKERSDHETNIVILEKISQRPLTANERKEVQSKQFSSTEIRSKDSQCGRKEERQRKEMQTTIPESAEAKLDLEGRLSQRLKNHPPQYI